MAYNEGDQEYQQFADDTQYWGRYETPDYMLSNYAEEETLAYDMNMAVAKQLHYAPHAQHKDDYFLDHRHHLSHGEIGHALELDPHNFHKVTPEPVHHEQKYFSEADYDLYSDDSEGGYYDNLIGYGN
jgi:hypothetical protein